MIRHNYAAANQLIAQGVSIGDAAKQTGIPAGALYTHRSQAKKKAKKATRGKAKPWSKKKTRAYQRRQKPMIIAVPTTAPAPLATHPAIGLNRILCFFATAEQLRDLRNS
jgi:hypothetical protein